MRLSAGLVLAAIVTLAAGCAHKAPVVAVPVVTTPHFPDFVKPTVPADLVANPAAVSHERAWLFLQAGDFRNADREVTVALKSAPAFYPAETAGAYVQLAEKDAKAALTRFDRALTRRGDYAPALAGKAEALLALNREAEAIDAFEAAVTADASLSDLSRRIDVLKFRGVQRDVSAARQAARSGKIEDALRAYGVAIEHSPESAFLYRERGVIEREQGNSDAALVDFRKAVALDPADAAAQVQVAEILDGRDDFEAALAAYAAALALDPNERVEARRNALLTRVESARLPADYRAIEAAPQISRGDLAALIGVRLASLLQVTRPRDVGVLTDIRGNWAQSWILAVTRAGILDPFANHTFQPRTLVRRVDFAQAVTRLLGQIAVVEPAQARKWANARGRFTDISAGHVAYPAASTAVAAGVMTTVGDGAFQPARAVTGAEAIAAIENLRAMASASDRERR